jgi:hypothetical protein
MSNMDRPESGRLRVDMDLGIAMLVARKPKAASMNYEQTVGYSESGRFWHRDDGARKRYLVLPELCTQPIAHLRLTQFA